MSRYLTQIKQELKKKDCQDCIKTWALMMAIMLSMTYFWVDWHDYLDGFAINLDETNQLPENPESKILILLGLLTIQWLPLYIMFRITFFLYPIISNQLGWYENFDRYMRTNLNRKDKV